MKVIDYLRQAKGFILDLDGTLLDSLEVYLKAFNSGLKNFGLPPIAKSQLIKFLNEGKGLEDMLIECSPCLFAKDHIRKFCMEEIKRFYFKAQSEVSLLPGARKLLNLLKQKGKKIGIVTGRTLGGNENWCELIRLGIAPFIDVLITAADAPRKPAPNGILRCLSNLGIAAKEAVFIGDSEADMIAAKRAGVVGIAVATGVAPKEKLLSSGALIVFNTLEDLLGIIT